MKRLVVGLLALAMTFGVGQAKGTTVDISATVPSYIWYKGCGPTALGMMAGYWDSQGFDSLIPGSSDWSTNQTAIENVIASPRHVSDYYGTTWSNTNDVPGAPTGPFDCLADFCGSSFDPMYPGWSYFHLQDDGLLDYAEYVGYAVDNMNAYQQSYYDSLWGSFMAAIDLGHPVELLVDSSGDGGTDHFVTAVGYDDTVGNERYACWDTWSHTLRWERFRPLSSSYDWGVYGGTFFSMTAIPEPSSIIGWSIIGLSFAGFGWYRRRRA